jgi:phosphoribosyl 1,2-cyclic phosphodiesterase
MSIEVCVLASGSSGNCTVVRTPAGVVLIDAGLGPRSTARRMDGTGVRIRDIRAICLTHLDSDHFRPSWLGTLLNHGIRIFCHRSRVRDVMETFDHEAIEPLISGFDDQTFAPVDDLSVRAIPLAHDRTGSHGFIFEGFGCRVGWATDLGQVSPALIDQFIGLDLLALESNYDHDMQLSSARPTFLKNRIMGGAGHLSNRQAYEAICRILDRAQQRHAGLPGHIVLLHRSRECNCPKLLRALFERDTRIARRLTLTEQFQRTEWLRIRPTPPLIGEQLALAFS